MIIAAIVAAVGLATPASAAFPGKNGKIAFDRYPSGSAFADIYSMNPDGSDLTNLTRRSPQDLDEQPAYSPDGKQIAWTRDDHIWLMNSDGSQKRRLTRTEVNYGVSFAPSGKKLIWTQVKGSHTYIKVMKVDGSAKRKLGVEGLNPAYSPDGQWIAYDRWNGAEDDIYTVFRNGESEVNLTASQSESARHPDWSPDGETIVYYRSTLAGGWDIFSMDPNGADVLPIVQGTASQMYPVVSPNGQQVLFQNKVSDSNFDIWKSGLTPSTPEQLTSDSGYDEFPAWQPR